MQSQSIMGLDFGYKFLDNYLIDQESKKITTISFSEKQSKNHILNEILLNALSVDGWLTFQMTEEDELG